MDKTAAGLTFHLLDAPLRPSAVVVAQDPLVRSGLVAVLAAYPGLVLKDARVADGEPAPKADVVVWDGPGVPANAACHVLALVSAPHEARQALRAGARGALSRSAAAASIGPAAAAVAAGHWVLDESFARELLHVGDPAPQTSPYVLSPREQEVLSLLSEGLSNRDVAERLGISRHTAKFHVNAILDKLGATTRTEAVVLAARSGLLSL